MPMVGYNVLPSQTFNLAEVDQNQQRIDIAKKQQQQEMMNTILGLVMKAKESQSTNKQTQQKLAADLYTKLVPTYYTYTDPTTGEVKTYTAGGDNPRMREALSRILGGAFGIKDQNITPEIGSRVSPQAVSQPSPTDYLNIMRQNRMGTTADYLSTLPQDKPISSTTGIGNPNEYAYNLLSKMGISAPKPNVIDTTAQVMPNKQQPQAIQPNQPMQTSGIKPPVGFMLEQSGGKTKLIKMPTGSSIDSAGLTTPQQIQGRALARKMYGVRGAELGLPAIYDEIRKGKTIDQIDDELRYSGQSTAFSGTPRNAVQRIMTGKSSNDKQSTFDDLDDLADQPEEQKSYLKNLAITLAPVEIQNQITGKERTVELLNEIESDINTLEKNGVNTNILNGTYEEVQGKLGMVSSPELRQLITKINTAIYNYRKNMSGVAFPDKETRDYKRIFPGGNKTKELNTANINALRDVFGGDVDYFYGRKMGKDNYRQLFGGKTSPSANRQTSQVSQPKTQQDYNALPSGSVYMDTDGQQKRKK